MSRAFCIKTENGYFPRTILIALLVEKGKIITFSNGTIRGFSNKNGKQYGTVNDFKKFSIQRITKNGTVRYGTMRYGTVRVR